MDIFCVKIAEREQISFGESVTFQKPEFWCRIRREKVVLLSGSECAILMTQNFGFWKTNRKWKLCKDDDLIDGSFIPGSRFILVRKSQFFAIFGNRRKKTFWWIKFRRFRFLLLLNIFGLKKTSFWTFKEANIKNNFHCQAQESELNHISFKSNFRECQSIPGSGVSNVTLNSETSHPNDATRWRRQKWRHSSTRHRQKATSTSKWLRSDAGLRRDIRSCPTHGCPSSSLCRLSSRPWRKRSSSKRQRPSTSTYRRRI